MAQLPLINSQTTQGYRKEYKKFVSRGNLNYMYQRLDVGLLEGDDRYPDRLYLKVGKVATLEAEFRNDKEQAQGWFETSPDIIRQLRKYLLAFEIKLRKKQNVYNYQYNLQEDLKQDVEIHKNNLV